MKIPALYTCFVLCIALNNLSLFTHGPSIAIIGTGYVGLVSGAGLAELGNRVVCVDIAQEKIDALNRGTIPIYEPGLQELVDKNVAAGHLTFSTDIEKAILESDVIFSAVGTPMGADGAADLEAVKNVVKTIAQHINGYKIIVTKSTVPVGTGAQLKSLMLEHGVAPELFDLVSNPEFLREGFAVNDFLCPDRIVIGTDSERAQHIMATIYKALTDKNVPIVYTNIPTSETIKYASNGFLATKIGFINEISNLCRQVGANVYDVSKAMGLDKRIGPLFLTPGPGFGGSCFPKDCHALVHTAQENHVEMRILQAVLQANEYQKDLAVELLKNEIGNDIQGKTIAILGLAFKANTDDIRYSPAINVIQILLDSGAHVRVYDPVASDNMRKIFAPDIITYTQSSYEAVQGADACIVMTEWQEFKSLDITLLCNNMHNKVIVDMRGIVNKNEIKKLRVILRGIER